MTRSPCELGGACKVLLSFPEGNAWAYGHPRVPVDWAWLTESRPLQSSRRPWPPGSSGRGDSSTGGGCSVLEAGLQTVFSPGSGGLEHSVTPPRLDTSMWGDLASFLQ